MKVRRGFQCFPIDTTGNDFVGVLGILVLSFYPLLFPLTLCLNLPSLCLWFSTPFLLVAGYRFWWTSPVPPARLCLLSPKSKTIRQAQLHLWVSKADVQGQEVAEGCLSVSCPLRSLFLVCPPKNPRERAGNKQWESDQSKLEPTSGSRDYVSNSDF